MPLGQSKPQQESGNSITTVLAQAMDSARAGKVARGISWVGKELGEGENDEKVAAVFFFFSFSHYVGSVLQLIAIRIAILVNGRLEECELQAWWADIGCRSPLVSSTLSNVSLSASAMGGPAQNPIYIHLRVSPVLFRGGYSQLRAHKIALSVDVCC